MFLTPDEISQLTNRQRRPAQRFMLNAMGIEHKVRPDGSIVVLRAHVERVFGGQVPGAKQPKPFTIAR